MYSTKGCTPPPVTCPTVSNTCKGLGTSTNSLQLYIPCSPWVQYTNLPAYLMNKQTTTSINDGSISFRFSTTTLVYLLRVDGWSVVDLTGWTLVESGKQYLTGYGASCRVYSKTFAAGTVNLNNLSAMYLFDAAGCRKLGGPTYLGCWVDSGNRALPVQGANVNSVADCAAQALQRGYSTFGLQYYGQCFMGNNKDWDRYVFFSCCCCNSCLLSHFSSFFKVACLSLPSLRENKKEEKQRKCSSHMYATLACSFLFLFPPCNLNIHTHRYGRRPSDSGCGTLGNSWSNQIYTLTPPEPVTLNINGYSW
jgi:hypothetical protein